MPGIWPPHDPPPPIRWWEVVFGGLAVALAAFGLIWIFAVLGFALQGEAIATAIDVPCLGCLAVNGA